MSQFQPWELAPQISFHAYCDRISNFLLEQDCYSEWALFAVEDGSFRYDMGELGGTAGAGEIVFCPPGKIFRRKTITPLSYHFARLCWKTPCGGSIVSSDAIPVGKVSMENRRRLYSTYAFLQLLSRKTDPFSVGWRNHLFHDIWNLYCIQAGAVPITASAITRTDPATDDPLMNRALQFIRDHAYQKMSIKEVSASQGLSQVQFTRRFHAAFQMSPMEYLTSLRLQKVQKLLSETRMTLSEIAGCCGYENEYYLSRVFTRKLQITPSEYRKVHRV